MEIRKIYNYLHKYFLVDYVNKVEFSSISWLQIIWNS